MISGDRLQPTLDDSEDRLIQKSTAVMNVFGVLLVGDVVAIMWAEPDPVYSP